MLLRSLFRVALLASIPTAACHAQLHSTFDDGADGWTCDAAGVAVSHVPTGGNPGGYLAADWNFVSGPHFVAPALFHGDLRGYDQGVIGFEAIRLAAGGIPSPGQAFGVVTIASPGGSAARDLAPEFYDPPFSWTTYQHSFDAASFGVSQDQWLLILSDVTEVTISLHTGWGHEGIGIDNFSIVPPPASATLLPMTLAFATSRRRRQAPPQ